MGNVFSFLKKNKTTKEQLEDLQNEIDKIEEYKILALVREKNYLALITAIFILVYIISLVYFYFDYRHDVSYRYKSLMCAFIIIFPIIVYYTRNIVGSYFKWVKESNNLKLVALIKLKKKILSKVQETETFNEARRILERYDPSALRNMSMSLTNLASIDRELSFTPRVSHVNQMAPSSTPRMVAPTHSRLMAPPAPSSPRTTAAMSNSLIRYNSTPMQPMMRTVKPILPQERSVAEKMVDYMFGDGPSNRYALICATCNSHNGMALPQEFEYISYICAYCKSFNAARKMRPNPPNIKSSSSKSEELKQKAIEGPQVEEPEDNENTQSTVKITELTSELNKTAQNLTKSTEEENEDEDDKASQKCSSPEPTNTTTTQDEESSTLGAT